MHVRVEAVKTGAGTTINVWPCETDETEQPTVLLVWGHNGPNQFVYEWEHTKLDFQGWSWVTVVLWSIIVIVVVVISWLFELCLVNIMFVVVVIVFVDVVVTVIVIAVGRLVGVSVASNFKPNTKWHKGLGNPISMSMVMCQQLLLTLDDVALHPDQCWVYSLGGCL